MIVIHSDGSHTHKKGRNIFAWAFIVENDEKELYRGGSVMTTTAGFDFKHAGAGYLALIEV